MSLKILSFFLNFLFFRYLLKIGGMWSITSLPGQCTGETAFQYSIIMLSNKLSTLGYAQRLLSL